MASETGFGKKGITPGAALTRRTVLGSAAALAMAPGSTLAAFVQDETQIPFVNDEQPQDMRNQVVWQQLREWHTPAEQLYEVSHYPKPEELENWRLRVTGLVENPASLSLAQIRERPRETYTALLECGGNGASARFSGAIGNMRWTGTPLLPVLEEAGVSPDGLEAVFFGADKGEEEIRGDTYEQQFARSLTLGAPALNKAMICYELNGAPLSIVHGAPVRLIVPGWYGVAWVKWLNRIDIVDRRYVGRFMSRDYVTLRGEETEDGTIWHRTLVGPINVKSVTSRAMRQRDSSVRVEGAAWTDGTPLDKVQLRIDDGPWQDVALEPTPDDANEHTWTFWRHVWTNPTPGAHTLVSRAIDAKGRVQPAASDPAIALKKTYWEANQQIVRAIELN